MLRCNIKYVLKVQKEKTLHHRTCMGNLELQFILYAHRSLPSGQIRIYIMYGPKVGISLKQISFVKIEVTFECFIRVFIIYFLE